MKFDLKMWIIVGLVALVVLLILFQPTPEPVNTAIWKTEIFNNKTKAERLKAKHEKDSTASAQKITELRDSLKSKVTETKRLALNLERLKAHPVVIKVRDSIPEIRATFETYDSLLESKDNQLAIQTAMISSLEAENVRITENFLERLELSQQAFDNQKLISDSYKKDTRKVRRQVKLFKVLTVVGAVSGLLLGNNL